MNTHTQAHELHPPRLSLGFGSQFSIVECVLSAITDEFHSVLKNRWPSIIFRTSVIMFTYFMGLPMVTRVSVHENTCHRFFAKTCYQLSTSNDICKLVYRTTRVSLFVASSCKYASYACFHDSVLGYCT